MDTQAIRKSIDAAITEGERQLAQQKRDAEAQKLMGYEKIYAEVLETTWKLVQSDLLGIIQERTARGVRQYEIGKTDTRSFPSKSDVLAQPSMRLSDIRLIAMADVLDALKLKYEGMSATSNMNEPTTWYMKW